MSVDGERTVRLLHRQEKAIDVRAADGGVGTDDRESVHSGIGDHGVGILRKMRERIGERYFEMTTCIAAESAATRFDGVDCSGIAVSRFSVQQIKRIEDVIVEPGFSD